MPDISSLWGGLYEKIDNVWSCVSLFSVDMHIWFN